MTHALRRSLVALFAATGLLACAQAATTAGSGTAATEERALGGFAAIALRGAIDIVVRQGTSERVQVRADDNLLALVQTVVEGRGDARTLRIEFKPGETVRVKTPVVVTVDVIRLAAVSSHGSGDISIDALQTPALALRIAGSSHARLRQLDTEQLSIGIAGSGDVQAGGRAARLDVSIAGSGDVRTRELAADVVSVSIAGSGDASVTAHKTLSVTVAGSGDVDYAGGASVTHSRVAGSDSVRQRRP